MHISIENLQPSIRDMAVRASPLLHPSPQLSAPGRMTIEERCLSKMPGTAKTKKGRAENRQTILSTPKK